MDQNMSRELHSGVENVTDHLPSEEIDKTSESLYCRLCNIRLYTLKLVSEHNEGKKHKARAAKAARATARARNGISLTCNVCNITADSEFQLNMHLKGRKHSKNLRKNEKDQQLLDGTLKVTTPSEKVDKILDPLYCRVCNVQLTSLELFSEHNEDIKHKARAAKAILLTCDVCNIKSNSEIQLNEHLNSRKHSKEFFKKKKKTKNVQHKARAARKAKALTCNLCNITLNSETQLNAHLNGRKHLEKL